MRMNKYSFNAEIENFSFNEDVLSELTPPKIRIMKHFYDDLPLKDLITKIINEKNKIDKIREFYYSLKQDYEIIKV